MPTAVKPDESDTLVSSNNTYGATGVQFTVTHAWENTGTSDTIIWTYQKFKVATDNWNDAVLTIGGISFTVLFKNSKNNRICKLLFFLFIILLFLKIFGLLVLFQAVVDK